MSASLRRGWGRGIATIYLLRVDPLRYVVVNGKSMDAYRHLGYPIRRSPLGAAYEDLLKAQQDVLLPHVEAGTLDFYTWPSYWILPVAFGLMTVLLGMRVVAVARGSFIDKPHDPAEEIDSHAGEQN